MGTRLGREFSPNYTGRPTHMSERDWVIWNKWHRTNWPKFMTLWFDIGVGDGVDAGPMFSKKYRDAFVRLTQKRIDVLGEGVNEIWLIEVRPNASASAMGSVLMYAELLREDNPFTKELKGVIITDKTDTNSRRIIDLVGIDLVEVGFD